MTGVEDGESEKKMALTHVPTVQIPIQAAEIPIQERKIAFERIYCLSNQAAGLCSDLRGS
jgi:hypothetical protein